MNLNIGVWKHLKTLDFQVPGVSGVGAARNAVAAELRVDVVT